MRITHHYENYSKSIDSPIRDGQMNFSFQFEKKDAGYLIDTDELFIAIEKYLNKKRERYLKEKKILNDLNNQKKEVKKKLLKNKSIDSISDINLE